MKVGLKDADGVMFETSMIVDSGADITVLSKRMSDIMEIDVYKKRYDSYTFEELPLYMKIAVISNHAVVFAREMSVLYEYFYFFRKLWREQERRHNVPVEEVKGWFG